MEKLSELLDYFSKQGYTLAPSLVVNSSRNALHLSSKIGFPLVMKINSQIHKKSAGGVFTSVRSEMDIGDIWTELSKRFDTKEEGVLLQKQIDGTELIIGLKYEKDFKDIIMLGAGGSNAETLNDTSFRLCPISENDADGMINELQLLKKMDKDRLNLAKLRVLLVNLSKIHETIEYKTMDFNPVIINKDDCYLIDIRKE